MKIYLTTFEKWEDSKLILKFLWPKGYVGQWPKFDSVCNRTAYIIQHLCFWNITLILLLKNFIKNIFEKNLKMVF